MALLDRMMTPEARMLHPFTPLSMRSLAGVTMYRLVSELTKIPYLRVFGIADFQFVTFWGTVCLSPNLEYCRD